jgi:hypothetical protein
MPAVKQPASDARLSERGVVTMGRQAADAFRREHPEISDEAINALTWCYTWDFK